MAPPSSATLRVTARTAPAFLPPAPDPAPSASTPHPDHAATSLTAEVPRPTVPLPDSFVIPESRRLAQAAATEEEADVASPSGLFKTEWSTPEQADPSSDAVAALKGLSVRSRPAEDTSNVARGQRRYRHSMTVDDVEHAIFAVTRVRPAYDMADVDAFLLRNIRALREGEDVAALVVGAEFGVVRWQAGYRMDDVNALLARLEAG